MNEVPNSVALIKLIFDWATDSYKLNLGQWVCFKPKNLVWHWMSQRGVNGGSHIRPYLRHVSNRVYPFFLRNLYYNLYFSTYILYLLLTYIPSLVSSSTNQNEAMSQCNVARNGPTLWLIHVSIWDFLWYYNWNCFEH